MSLHKSSTEAEFFEQQKQWPLILKTEDTVHKPLMKSIIFNLTFTLKEKGTTPNTCHNVKDCFIESQISVTFHTRSQYCFSNDLFHAIVLIRIPYITGIFAQHQFAIVGQGETTLVAFVNRICVPSGLVTLVVHDQVTVMLHAQANSIWAICVWCPHRLPSIDHKVRILLQTDKWSVCVSLYY